MRKSVDKTNAVLEFPETLDEVAGMLVRVAKELVHSAKTEEDLRIGFERRLIPLIEGIGVPIHSQYEKTILKQGRSDAVHGQVIIEYERPGAFHSGRSVEHAKEQLINYITGETKSVSKGSFFLEPRMVGVGFDGKMIFYVHYIGDKTKPKTEIYPEEFAIFGPYPFNISNARTLITYIRLLVRRLLSPDSLADVFGPKGKVAPMVVSALVDALENWDLGKRGQLFYNEWRRLFGIVYGEQFQKTISVPASTLTKWYHMVGTVEFPKLLFAVHTYFALLMKIIAAELLTVQVTSYRSSLSNDLALSSSKDFSAMLLEIESGGVYAKRGITNFLEGDFFRWYLDTSSPRLEDAIREMARAFAGFEPGTPIIYPEPARDLLKRIYQFLVPSEVRHSLGEYYTPDWLAELILDEVGYDGNTLHRILDPACGSGTFLVFSIQRAIQYGHKHNEQALETAKRVISHIWGFDLNPLAVIAARTNYIFALGDLVSELKEFEIPVYLADSVLWPERKGQGETDSTDKKVIVVQTSLEKPFHVPAIWVEDNGFLMKIAAPIIERDVKKGFGADIGVEHLRQAGCVFPPHEDVITQFYKEVEDLEDQHKNGIWARFIKNLFAPVTAEPFDFVIGNPPWIRWGYLADSYREATLPMWKNYGLFSLRGHEARLGGGEKDFSMLFTYVAADYYLKKGGKLGFLITQEVFKAKGAGEGFRRFQLGESEHLKVIAAHDLTTVQPFEGAANKTSAIILKKGQKTKYPVPYTVWERKRKVGKIPTSYKLEQAKPLLNKRKLNAKPIDDETGSWLTISQENSQYLVVKGKNYYLARRGASTEPYGVFWLEIVQVFDDELLVRNLPERGKRDIPKVSERIESHLVFPAVRGADIERWRAEPGVYVLITQDIEKRYGISEEEMMLRSPRTFSYLVNFKEILLSRAAYKKYHKEEGHPFYSQYNIANYTFANYKVVWKRMASKLVAAVITQYKTSFGHKSIIPTDTTSLFACDAKEEAHYLCALLNSNPIGKFIKAYSSAGRGFGAPSVMQHIGIPRFNAKNHIHAELSKCSIELHDLKALNSEEGIDKLEDKVDELTLKLFK